MLAGSLTEFTLPDVFTLLATTRKSGVLNLTSHDSAAGRVWILHGKIAFAVADVTRSPLAARLLHGGEVGPADVEALVRAQAAGDGVRMAAALAGVGVALDRATTLLRDQVIDAAFDLCRWSGGDFAFDAAALGPAEDMPTFDAADVMAAVDARMAEWEGIVATLPSPASVLRLVSRPPTEGGSVVIAPDQWEVLTLVDGMRSAAEIIRLTGQGQFIVAKVLSALVGSGLVALHDDESSRSITHQRADQLARLEHEALGAPLPGVLTVAPAAPVPPPAQPAVPAPPAEETAAPAAPAPDEEAVTLDVAAVDVDLLRAGAEPPRPVDDRAGPAEEEDTGFDLDVLLAAGGSDEGAPGDAQPPPGQHPAGQDTSSGGTPLDEDLLTRLIDGVKGV